MYASVPEISAGHRPSRTSPMLSVASTSVRLKRRATPKSRILVWSSKPDHQIVRLDVSVDPPVLVGHLQTAGDLHPDAGQCARLADLIGERLAQRVSRSPVP